MSCDPSRTCPICDQRGLPILPLRYAVARCDDGVKDKAPKLQAPFGEGVEQIPLPADSAHYTLRLLRPGYLYVFNEARGEWKAYVVNDNAYLTEFDIHARTPPDIGDAQPCERMQNAAAGRCVMIPDAARAGGVWLGFSDTAWTAAVLDKHRRQAWRERHMQRINVGTWARGKATPAPQPHLARIDRLTELVCEFALPAPKEVPLTAEMIATHETAQARKPAGERSILLQPVSIRPYPALDYSLHDYHNQQLHAQDVVDAATVAAGDFAPAMVGLQDPVGITMELARLPAARLEDFIARTDSRPLAVSTAIDNLRNVVMDDAENREIYRTERNARNVVLNPGHMGMGDGGGAARGGQAIADWLFPEQAKQREELFERWRNPSAAQLQAARNKAWASYTRKYREPQRAAFVQQWQAQLRAFDQAVVAPLVQAHVDWMRSAGLYEKFDGTHDDQDAHSGQAFVDTLTLCIQDTQQYAPCARLYTQWLGATTIERSNLLLRALAWNQKQVIDRLEGFSQGGLRPESLRGLPWGGLITGYDAALGALADGGKNAVVRLTAALGGPFATLAGKAVDGMIGPALVAMGAIAKAPVVMVDVVMSKSDAIAELTARMTALNPKVSDLPSLHRAIDIQMRKARIYGTPIAGTGNHRYLLLADPKVIEDFPGIDATGRPTGRRFAESAILTEDDRRRLTRIRWKKLLPGAAGLGVVTAILQVTALNKLADDLDQSMAHEANENSWRYRAGMAALAGTLAETTGRWTESASTAGSRMARFMEHYVGKALRFVGKGIGIGAGAVMAVWDGWRGWQEVQEGNSWVGALFFGSAVVSVGAAFAFSTLGVWLFGAAATGVGIVLVVLVVVIAVLIEVLKDNAMQDWLERCYFGVFESGKRYQSAQQEMSELRLAVAG
ncbi:hypothetical protein E4582_05075 [Luteimonas yindakuii]|uniref:Toxin VasX N-terminal region domain-containing protein n=1 Tax=Luteimonas yindakuii TaxID=2565782 RepID=A0A4Z1RKS9_9GAMM|nr:T6SS effector BTH_I2691 family protein [Luteimonas yindakuii]TKS54201.1 hypothetical protein E4582_05075 [Luteimonas yindakuii]